MLCLAACAQPPEMPEDVEATFRELHAPVYEVFALGLDRDAVHELLAASFAGEALTDRYIDHWTTLVRMHEDDTAITISGVEHDRVESLGIDETGALRLDVAWTVRGVVRHQDHRHAKIHAYRAVYELRETTEGWRITGERQADVRRVEPSVDADALFSEEEGSGAAEGFIDPLEMFEAGLFDEEPTTP